ncbi:peptidylprolyl isomerase [Terriglobus sp. TAA 43]|uniref:peptidylprolyl isomerase n=1 Tax=Terriglobus sp. TAA 43 TaxID=278961 RepID=UPI00068C49B1|nr:peptidylprolyl isomerase [Terriglobus sp. TAA 43]
MVMDEVRYTFFMRIPLSLIAVVSIAVSPCISAQMAVMDTSMGRVTCHLFADRKPATTAMFVGLANGTIAWDGGTAKPFYDGTVFRGSSGAISGGLRSGVVVKALADTPLEEPGDRNFDAPGLLAMIGEKGKMAPRFTILDHANAESDSPNRSIFGLCDAASVKVVQEISHLLTSADNDPSAAVKLLRVSIVEDAASAPPPLTPVPLPPVVQAKLQGPEPTGRVAVFHTSMGNLTCRLFEKESPIAAQIFVSLADGTKDWTNPKTHSLEHGVRFYDGMIFDRVLPDFVIQTGDITNDPSGATDIGFRFKNEDTPGLTYDRPGRLAFGNNGKDTNNSELFFSEHPMHRLDGGFTIIGQCDDTSVKRIEAIARVPRDEHNRPLTPVIIRSVTIHK